MEEQIQLINNETQYYLKNLIVGSSDFIQFLFDQSIAIAKIQLQLDDIVRLEEGFKDLIKIFSQKQENISFFCCYPLFMYNQYITKLQENKEFCDTDDYEKNCSTLDFCHASYLKEIQKIIEKNSSMPHFIFCLGNEGLAHTNLLVVYKGNLYSFDTVPAHFLSLKNELVLLNPEQRIRPTKRTFEFSKYGQCGCNFFDSCLRSGFKGDIFLNCGLVFTADQGSCIKQTIKLKELIEQSAIQCATQKYNSDIFEKALKSGLLEYKDYFDKYYRLSGIKTRKNFLQPLRAVTKQNKFLIEISQFLEHKESQIEQILEK